MHYLSLVGAATCLLAGSTFALPSNPYQPKRDNSVAIYSTTTPTTPAYPASTPYDGGDSSDDESASWEPETSMEEALVQYVCSSVYATDDSDDQSSDSQPYNGTDPLNKKRSPDGSGDGSSSGTSDDADNDDSDSDSSDGESDGSDDDDEGEDQTDIAVSTILYVLCSDWDSSQSSNDSSLRRRSGKVHLSPMHKRAAKAALKTKTARTARRSPKTSFADKRRSARSLV